MKVLLVDDEQKFALMLAKRLELRGFIVAVTFTGKDALEIVKSDQSFDVALLDVKMPGIGGIELRRQLAVLDPKIKFVFLTGHGSDADYHAGVSEADEYLPKPLKIEDLIETLDQLK